MAHMDLLRKSIVVLDNISDRLFATMITVTIDANQLSQQVWKAAQVNHKLVESAVSDGTGIAHLLRSASGTPRGWI